jgi:hypothetical protein
VSSRGSFGSVRQTARLNSSGRGAYLKAAGPAPSPLLRLFFAVFPVGLLGVRPERGGVFLEALGAPQDAPAPLDAGASRERLGVLRVGWGVLRLGVGVVRVCLGVVRARLGVSRGCSGESADTLGVPLFGPSLSDMLRPASGGRRGDGTPRRDLAASRCPKWPRRGALNSAALVAHP